MVFDDVISGGGFVLNTLVAGLFLLTLCIVTVLKVVRPTMESYRRSKKLDKIAGAGNRHWFFGHMRQVSLYG